MALNFPPACCIGSQICFEFGRPDKIPLRPAENALSPFHKACVLRHDRVTLWRQQIDLVVEPTFEQEIYSVGTPTELNCLRLGIDDPITLLIDEAGRRQSTTFRGDVAL